MILAAREGSRLRWCTQRLPDAGWRCRRRLLAVPLALFSWLALAAPVVAGETAHEFWPEVDVWIRLDDHFRLSPCLSLSSDLETKYREGIALLQLDYSWRRGGAPFMSRRLFDEARATEMNRFMVRGGYLAGKSLADDGRSYSERQAFLELHLRNPLKGGFLLSHRLRTDLRFIGDDRDFSWRLRYRLQAEKEYHAIGTSVVPYASLESSFDERYSAINRMRAIGGATVALSRRFVAEANITYQYDSHLPVSNLFALNAILNVYF
jgi:hypothetical protein